MNIEALKQSRHIYDERVRAAQRIASMQELRAKLTKSDASKHSEALIAIQALKDPTAIQAKADIIGRRIAASFEMLLATEPTTRMAEVSPLTSVTDEIDERSVAIDSLGVMIVDRSWSPLKPKSLNYALSWERPPTHLRTVNNSLVMFEAEQKVPLERELQDNFVLDLLNKEQTLEAVCTQAGLTG